MDLNMVVIKNILGSKSYHLLLQLVISQNSKIQNLFDTYEMFIQEIQKCYINQEIPGIEFPQDNLLFYKYIIEHFDIYSNISDVYREACIENYDLKLYHNIFILAYCNNHVSVKFLHN